MTSNWTRSLNIFHRRREQEHNNLVSFLETLPQAAIYIHSTDQKILLANEKATELFNQPKHIIERSHLNELVINLTKLEGRPELISPGVFVGNFHPKSAPVIDENVQLFVTALEQQKYLVLIQPLEGLPQNKTQSHLVESILEGLSDLVIHPSMANDHLSFQPVLKWVNQLVNAQATVLYLADEEIPSFLKVESYGEFTELPEELISQDLKAFQAAFVWETGRKSLPISNLTNTILGNQPSFLATIPIGQSKALVGFLIIIGGRLPPPSFTRQAGVLATNIIHQLIEYKSQQASYKTNTGNLVESKRAQEISEKYIQEGILVLSREAIIKRINPAVEKIFGYASSEIINQSLSNILIGYESLNVDSLNLGNLVSPRHLPNVSLFRRNGDKFLANIYLIPASPDVDSSSIVVIIEDLSEKERIRVQTEQLEQRAYIGEVMAVFAHDVRNPVNNISTGLQLLARNLPEEDSNQPEIARMLQDCDRLGDLMKSVLNLSKQQEYQMEPIQITELLNVLINRRMSRLQYSGIEYEFKFDPDTPKIMGDIRGLERVFNNLINNAIQAMSETGGKLIIRTQAVGITSEINDGFVEQPFLEVSIADTGPGIPIEIQDTIFEPFFTTRTTGTGLGLSIVKRIVTIHKGTIRMESFPGGTIFYLNLPAIKPESRSRK